VTSIWSAVLSERSIANDKLSVHPMWGPQKVNVCLQLPQDVSRDTLRVHGDILAGRRYALPCTLSSLARNEASSLFRTNGEPSALPKPHRQSERSCSPRPHDDFIETKAYAALGPCTLVSPIETIKGACLPLGTPPSPEGATLRPFAIYQTCFLTRIHKA
jgi:hypothetical protein